MSLGSTFSLSLASEESWFPTAFTATPTQTLYAGGFRPDTVSTTFTTSSSLAAPVSVLGSNVIAIDLATTLTVSDYTRYFDTPIESFRATYSAIPDGSLISPSFQLDMKHANGMLIALAVLLTLFTRNIALSIEYIRRGKVRHKGLFYTLLSSQLLGPVVVVPLIASYFQTLECTVVISIVCTALILSQSLLTTGILGVKAYRCLNNSRFVLAVISLFQIAIIVFTVLDFLKFNGTHKLTGSCALSGHTKLISVVFFLFFVETLFISGALFYAIRKSSRMPAARGRLSIRISTERNESSGGHRREGDIEKDANSRRGWWDYIPEEKNFADHASQNSSYVECRPWHLLWTRLKNLMSRTKRPPPSVYERKPSLPGVHPPSQSRCYLSRIRRLNAVALSSSNPSGGVEWPRADCPPSVSTRRFSKLIPRMQLFKEVLRDELCYTAFIASTCVISTILSVIGVSGGLIWGPAGWIGLNWALISVFVMQSFGRVVRRHEREAMLQHPSTWDPVYRAEQALLFASRRPLTNTRTYWPSTTASHRRMTRSVPGHSSQDPFEDFRDSAVEDGEVQRPKPTAFSWNQQMSPLSVTTSASLPITAPPDADSSMRIHWANTEGNSQPSYNRSISDDGVLNDSSENFSLFSRRSPSIVTTDRVERTQSPQ